MKVVIEPRYATAIIDDEDQFYSMMASAIQQTKEGTLTVLDFLSWLDLDIATKSQDDRRYIFQLTFTPTMDENSNDTVLSIDWKCMLR